MSLYSEILFGKHKNAIAYKIWDLLILLIVLCHQKFFKRMLKAVYLSDSIVLAEIRLGI